MRQNIIDEMGYYMDEMRIAMDAYLYGPIGDSAKKVNSPLAEVSKLARRVYTVLQMKGVATMGELASAVGQSTKSIYRPVEELIKFNIVEKYPNPDKRTQILCSFTPYGKQVSREIDDVAMRTAKDILESSFTDDEIIEIVSLCKDLSALLKKMGDRSNLTV